MYTMQGWVQNEKSKMILSFKNIFEFGIDNANVLLQYIIFNKKRTTNKKGT